MTGVQTCALPIFRVDSLSYFQYRYGHEPVFLFGTNAYGQDILTRMAEGARFSLLFALIISAINLAIGAVYGIGCHQHIDPSVPEFMHDGFPLALVKVGMHFVFLIRRKKLFQDISTSCSLKCCRRNVKNVI